MAEHVTFRITRPFGEVTMTLEIFEEDDQRVCGLRWLEGTIRLGPKAMRAAITTELTKIEEIARSAGCHEMRHAGDDRARFLPGYEPMDGLKNGRRKVL